MRPHRSTRRIQSKDLEGAAGKVEGSEGIWGEDGDEAMYQRIEERDVDIKEK